MDWPTLSKMTVDNKMILNIKGSNKDYRKLIESAAHYYAEILVSKRLLKTIKITF